MFSILIHDLPEAPKTRKYNFELKSIKISKETIKGFDLILLSTDHDDVDYKLIEVKSGEYPFFKGQVWADPSVEHAAIYMQKLVQDDEYRNTIAEAGRSYINAHHNTKVIGTNYKSRLVELGLLRD